jgi:hypothetical protein
MKNEIYQGWDKWVEKFKPINNHFTEDPDEQMFADEHMSATNFATHDEELEFVQKADGRHVWTYIEGDESDVIVAGYHNTGVKRGHYITTAPWEDEDDYALISVQSECECYSEDEDVMESRNDEFGDPNCQECDGYGLVTRYVD